MYLHSIIFDNLKHDFKRILLSLLLCSLLTSIKAQNFKLNVQTKESVNTGILTTLQPVKNHKTKNSILKEVKSISKRLASLGFINNSYHLVLNDSVFTSTYTLSTKIDSIRVYFENKLLYNHLLLKITRLCTPTYFEIHTSQIEDTLNQIISFFENRGASFSEISLSNLEQQNSKLTATLQLNISEERKINKVVIKGYNEFPKAYLKHHLNLKQNAPFSKNTLNEVNDLLYTIPFVTQLKKPAVLFTNDSTTLFLYLKKRSISKFDGIIGFSNEENSKNLLFTGYIDLHLNNLFNKGESFDINWKNNGNDSQSLNLKFSTPYVFNTKISTIGEFSIFKQDSSYVNNKSEFKVNYQINRKNSLNVSISNERSNLTSLSNNLIGIEEFKNTFLGIAYTYKLLSGLTHNYSPKFSLNAAYLTGSRTIESAKNKQYKFQFTANYILELNMKNSIYFKSMNELLHSSSLFQNELFRIGGTNSIRGFDEQSVFTSKYAITNIEYHYAINPTTHVYTITDIGLIEDDITSTITELYGIGIGYYFKTNYSIINLSYAIGKHGKSPFKFNNSKVHVKITYPF